MKCFLLLILISFSAILLAYKGPIEKYQQVYFKSRVGCLSSSSILMKLECTNHKLAFDILKTLNRSRRKNAKEDLHKLVYNRARYFLDRREYDYFSIISLMVFPINDRERWLQEFSSIPGKRIRYGQMALDILQKGSSPLCKKGDDRFYIKEICTIKK